VIELLLIYWLASGLVTDAVVSRRRLKEKDGRYGFWHFVLAMATGWFIVPLAVGLWMLLTILQAAK
jgi:hypothetical protein